MYTLEAGRGRYQLNLKQMGRKDEAPYTYTDLHVTTRSFNTDLLCILIAIYTIIKIIRVYSKVSGLSR